MATSSGISSSSPASIQEIKRNNKRKFEGYLPYEKYVQLKNDFVNHHARICDICRRIVFGSRKEPPSKGLPDTQVEDMVLSHLEVIYKKVIKDLTSYGHTEAVAVRAVLAIGICYGCRDTITNALKHALNFLMCGMSVEEPKNHNVDKDLKTLVGFVTMAEYNGRKMQCPILCLDDFLFWLLIYTVPHFDSSTMANDLFNSSGSQITSPTSLRFNEESIANSSTAQLMPEDGFIRADELNLSLPHSEKDFDKLELNTIMSNPELSLAFFHLGFSVPTPNAAMEKPISPYDSLVHKFSSLKISRSSILEEKPMDSSLKHEVSSNRDFGPRRTSSNKFSEKPKTTLLHSSSSLLKFNTIDGLKTSESGEIKNFSFDDVKE